MNKINRRFLHYETRAKFEEDLDKIPYDAIVFIDEGRTIYTHGEEYCNVDLSEYIKAQDIEQEYAKKTDIPNIPTNISAFINDVGYLTDHQNLSSYINDVELDKINKLIKFKHGNSIICTISTTDFIKDGMVNTVSIDGNNLVVTFNTDAGKQPISIRLADIFNPDNYYTKSQVDNTFAKKIDIPEQQDLSGYLKSSDAEDLYAKKTDVPEQPDLSNYYTKEEVDDAIDSVVGEDLSEYLKSADAETIYVKQDNIEDIVGSAITESKIRLALNIGADESNYVVTEKNSINEFIKILRDEIILSPNPEEKASNYAWEGVLFDKSLFDVNGDGNINIMDVVASNDLRKFALGLIGDYAKKHYGKEYVEKDDENILGVDTEARALAQEAKDAADAAQETAESKQNKLTAGNGLIINNNVISIRDLANGGNSLEALIANVENAIKSLQRALIGMFVRRDEVYKDVDDWGDDITNLIDVKIGSPYFYVIFKTLCAENVPQHEGGDTWTVSENICELDDKTLILN